MYKLMAEEAKVTPAAEEIAPKEGTVEAEIAKVAPETKKEETVPLSVYLALKDDVKELKKEIRDSKESNKPKITIEGVKDLAKKYPDVSEDFIADILGSATSQAAIEIDKKYTPLLAKQDEKEKQEAFDKAFTNVYNKALQDNPDLPVDKIDKDVIKTLALTPAYRNVPIADIITKIYGGEPAGKSTTENDMRSGADREIGTVDLSKPLTREQEDAVLADPVARKKYFDKMDGVN